MVFGRHEEVTRFWGMVRCLFGDVVAFGSVWVVPVTGEDLTKNWIEWLLDSTGMLLVLIVEGLATCAYGGLMCQPLR